jgi:hypothetical protein
MSDTQLKMLLEAVSKMSDGAIWVMVTYFITLIVSYIITGTIVVWCVLIVAKVIRYIVSHVCGSSRLITASNMPTSYRRDCWEGNELTTVCNFLQAHQNELREPK